MRQYCIKAIVSGRVQGVGYRYATRRQALRAGLTGYASNLANGDVEVVLCGERQAVDRVVDWLERGPPSAWVTHVQAEQFDEGDYTTFATD